MVIEAQELQGQLTRAREEVARHALDATPAPPAKARRQEREAKRRLRELERQLAALRWARRLLATWHTIHIPLGMVLFVMAFVHIGAALYYATLLR